MRALNRGAVLTSVFGGRLLAAAAIGRGGDPEEAGESELNAIAGQIRSAALGADFGATASRSGMPA